MTTGRIISWMMIMAALGLLLPACRRGSAVMEPPLGGFSRSIRVENWQFDLRVEDPLTEASDSARTDYYIKAILFLSNHRTGNSLLFSLADDAADYERKYKYLAFESRDDFYIQWGDSTLYPIGYVFEPSDGLSKAERLVYKFRIPHQTYQRLWQEGEEVAYWYIDRLIGLGKICFRPQGGTKSIKG